ILADEPTGALDSKTGEDIMQIFDQLHREGKTIVVVTHDIAVANHANRMIILEDGDIVKDSLQI
ncbi:MAG: macrolide ABC transporter ATP-binding protein, partial [Lachnospiraceae bacterium]|nr:macrolide ABC transporter ATP-binding protein [Lachnospiraceae bacterium]